MAAGFGDKTLRQYEILEEVSGDEHRLQGLPGCLGCRVAILAAVCPCQGGVVSQ